MSQDRVRRVKFATKPVSGDDVLLFSALSFLQRKDSVRMVIRDFDSRS